MEDLEKWLDCDPLTVALKTGNRVLADRVDILRRSRSKLPTYYACRAVFSRIALEQSSSEAVAAARNYPGGSLAIDLTTGLGVDALYLSKSYDKVITVELDPGRASDAVANFSLMGIGNIEVVNGSAEEFIEGFEGRADIIFIDPARRSDGGDRIYDIRKTTPDVLSMLPTIMSKCRSLMIKCSPMFDVGELHRIFGDDFSVETVSLDGECKETVVRYDGSPSRNMVTVISSSGGIWRTSLGFGSVHADDEVKMEYLISFDAAVVKAGAISKVMGDIPYIQAGSYVISESPLSIDSVTCCRRISSIVEYHPARIRKMLRGNSYTIMRKGFPVSLEILKRELGIKEGGLDIMAFVQVGGKRYMLSLEASQ